MVRVRASATLRPAGTERETGREGGGRGEEEGRKEGREGGGGGGSGVYRGTSLTRNTHPPRITIGP